jgi:PKD repeat protein
LVALLQANPPAWALDPGQPPGGNFDLSHWKVQLPTSNDVLTCNNGSVDEKTPAQLEAGFTNTYFYTGTDGAMVFWAPINGATTSGSSYPRSELRELINPSSSTVNWIPFGTHVLDAQCKVLQVPGSKKVIIGQIHAYSSAALPTVKIYYNNGNVYGTVKTNSTDDASDFKFPSVSVGLSNIITYQIKVVNGLVTIAYNNKTNSLNIFQSDPNYTNETQYFKAGDYCQSNACSNPLNQGALVAFYAVNLFHAPSITNQPVSQVVTVGSNVTFTVGAAGNPPLRYFWQFNSVPMGGKTNAMLSIPNVQLTNAGNYSVIITDYVGTVTSVVTSSVATLTVNPLAPTANFTATPTNGVAPLQVVFTDTSSGSPTIWAWDFGDAGTSTLQSPSHNYTTAGVYTVSLIASNAGGSSTNTKAAYINAITPLQSWSTWYGVPGDSADADGDGLSNTNEFLAGFNPTNSVACLHIIGVARFGSDINITYRGANGDSTWPPGVASRTNVLEYSAGGADGRYTNNFVSIGVSQVLSNGTGLGVVTNMVDPGGATNAPTRYYRIRVLAP